MPAEAARLSLLALPGIPEIRPGDDLPALLLAALQRAGEKLVDGDVIVLAQKIVSKAEGRLARLDDIEASPRAKEIAKVADKDPRVVELILGESNEVLRQRPGVIVVEHKRGYVLANAGIDASNVQPTAAGEEVLLLPADADASAERIRAALEKVSGKRLAVVINDSLGRAWRNGTIGTALGASGLPGLLDLRGKPDRHGRELRTTEIGAADEVAAAASLLMGQADEGRPAILLRGFPYSLREGNAAELVRPKGMDLFR
jgi:coenzyme F420-0:L-glutamate ligase / coenzyme F420-1:gamma-L-glutamate ligase